MSHESKIALERIVAVCERSENLSNSQIRIFDIALEGLGLVHGQRVEKLANWQQPHIEKMRERQANREARMAEQGYVYYRGYHIERGSIFLRDGCVRQLTSPKDLTDEEIAVELAGAKAWIDAKWSAT